MIRRLSMSERRSFAARAAELASTPSGWNSVLDEVSRATGSTGAVLLQAEERTSDVPRTETVAELAETYFREGWHVRDLRARAIPLMRNGIVVVDEDIATDDEIRASPYYNDFITPSGFRHFGVSAVWSGDRLWGLSVQRTARDGPLSAGQKAILAGLSETLSETATLERLLGTTVLRSGVDAIAGLERAAVAVTASGRVLEASESARALAAERVLTLEPRLGFPDARAASQLRSQIARVALDSEDLRPRRPIVARSRDGRAHLAAWVLPPHAAARTPFVGAAALIALVALDAQARSADELLQDALGLTKAEARLAATLAGSETLASAAISMGVGYETARTQLRSAIARVGARRQADFLRLIDRVLRG